MPVRLLGKDIVKALGKVGWELERVTGSHHVMRHADGRHVSVPVHGARPLPVGTLASICRQVGRSVDELRDLLQEIRHGVSLSLAPWTVDTLTVRPSTDARG
jgi:predicted RNA binding protein YcfA (HicA-like mRNA interferase family)